MKVETIPFAAGVDREGTEYSAGYTWYDSDKVRFQRGRAEKIGGFQNYSVNMFYGIARALYNYRSAAGTEYIALGTTQKFLIEDGGAYADVTPIRETTSAGDVTFSASDGSSTITVSDTSHGAVSGDWVTFSGAVTLGGVITAAILNKEYQVDSVVDADSYEITALDGGGSPINANASDTGNGGASVVGAYQLNIGLNAYVASVGWGFGPYGSGTWNGTSSFSVANQLRLWSLDNFGDDMLGCIRGGGIYRWDESAGTSVRADALPDIGGQSEAPTAALQVMVSDVDRHVIAFGVNPIGSSDIDPLFVRWSTRESALDWKPSSTNSAGGRRLAGGSVFIGALQTKQEILIWTDSSIHSMRYRGGDFVFDIEQVDSGVSMISPMAATAVGDTVYFMDGGGFYVYDGRVRRLPCSVRDYVIDQLNYSQSFKVFAFTDYDHSEVTWMYPTGVGTEECTDYVTYNFLDKVWYIGTYSRGAWIPTITKENPVASTADQTGTSASNRLYFHEIGWNDNDGNGITSYLESGDMEIDDGDQFIFLGTVIPDFTFFGSSESVTTTVKGKRYPSETSTTLDTGTVDSTTKKLDFRCRARSINVRFESTGEDFGWRLGKIRGQLKADGRR